MCESKPIDRSSRCATRAWLPIASTPSERRDDLMHSECGAGRGKLNVDERRLRSRAPWVAAATSTTAVTSKPLPPSTEAHVSACSGRPGARSAITTGTAAAPHASRLGCRGRRGFRPARSPGRRGRRDAPPRPWASCRVPRARAAPSAAGAMDVRWSVAVSGRISRPSRSAGASRRGAEARTPSASRPTARRRAERAHPRRTRCAAHGPSRPSGARRRLLCHRRAPVVMCSLLWFHYVLLDSFR